MCPLESATYIVSRRPYTFRYRYHNIENILYKLVIKQILFLDLAGGFGSLDEFEMSPVDPD
jgi:hypothetical protein